MTCEDYKKDLARDGRCCTCHEPRARHRREVAAIAQEMLGWHRRQRRNQAVDLAVLALLVQSAPRGLAKSSIVSKLRGICSQEDVDASVGRLATALTIVRGSSPKLWRASKPSVCLPG